MIAPSAGVLRRARHLAVAGVAVGLTLAGLAGPATAAPADQHPASAGWTQLDGKWTQIQAGHPHAALNAKTVAEQRQRAATSGGLAPRNQYDLQMAYHGGQDSIGVTTGPPKVYLIYWGSQWGSQSKNADGDTVLSGDPESSAPYQQEFFKGLGTNGDGWSAVMTQYCEGVAAGSTACPAGAPHVGYPQGGTLAGVWVDDKAPAPGSATEPQIAAEAAAAAAHFGNTTAQQNRNVQYVINTSQGTDPDRWLELGYCAWHTFERTSFGTIPYTIMPYLTDNKYCGTNWINPGQRGHLDGYGIIGGHEYAETITDQNAIGGWTDATNQENGDKCAWIPQGSNGGLFNLQLATGTFPVQTTWSNYDHACTGNDPIVANPPLVLSAMCDRTTQPGDPVSVPVIATDATSGRVGYGATGLPAGLSIDQATGVITGHTTATGYHDVHVTASDTQGNRQETRFWWGFFPGRTGCLGVEQFVDAGFENGSATVNGSAMDGAWNPSTYNLITPSSAHQARTGSWYAWLGQNTATDDSIQQWVETTPGYTEETFSFYLNVATTDTATNPEDTLSLELVDQYTGHTLATVRTWSNLDATKDYGFQSVNLTPYVAAEFGSTVAIKLVSHETSGKTAFLIDDTSLRLF
ncbi:hypothetical protein F0L68_15920 [Solihabitans fulvus]|uniref:Uncharacterized protein n=1 Tax=Solihabitans fulvus TaxID=1892852 RepID=A0A5B2XEA3_9PSEU|nr:Ig domain-containing protein [Solihabitans fulvus]KAA2261566.1 hypothetical protein F0L68_15920 [Solihabitans fulvus]